MKEEREKISKDVKSLNEKIKKVREMNQQETSKIPSVEEKIEVVREKINEIRKEKDAVKKAYNDEIYYYDEQQELIAYIKEAEKQKGVIFMLI
jgi:predicted  nucleic acid-binding Zn-ribbon protein